VQLTAFENAYAERWVRSAKEECLSKIILFGERSLRRAMSEYVAHYHAERNHQGNPTSCYFLGSRKPGVKSLSSVERGWAGSCVITIETPRELTARRGYEVAQRS
jgi:hypothetical protein